MLFQMQNSSLSGVCCDFIITLKADECLHSIIARHSVAHVYVLVYMIIVALKEDWLIQHSHSLFLHLKCTLDLKETDAEELSLGTALKQLSWYTQEVQIWHIPVCVGISGRSLPSVQYIRICYT